MPLGRYFAFIGGSLLALIFLIDWLVPQKTVAAADSDIDRTAIRIHSAHKWPSAVVFDTTLPTIVPPPQPAPVQAAATEPPPVTPKSPRDALAQMTEVPPVATAHPAPPKHVKRRAKAPRHPTEQVASYETFGFRPLFVTGW